MSVVTVVISSGLLEVFELTVARALDLHEEGHDVTMVYCDGSAFAGCTTNPFGWKSVCRSCNAIYKKAFSGVPAEVRIHPITLYRPSRSEPFPARHQGTEEIRNGVASTLLTNYRVADRKIARSFLLRRIARRYEAYSEIVFQSVSAYLQHARVDRLEFYNGRLVPTRALLAAATLAGKDFTVLESWGSKRSMRLYPNTTPHEFQYNKRVLERFLTDPYCDQNLGHKFFVDRRNGLRTNDRSYTSGQSGTVVKPEFERPVISFFLGSPDELKVAGDEFFTAWSLQPERFIAEVHGMLRDRYDFVVRMHPNQHGDRTGETERSYRALRALPGVRVIKPLDPTSSYELMSSSNYVITFGSTIGLEATYWGKVSILVGRAIWEDANVVHRCDSPSGLVELLRADPRPLSQENAVRIGYHFMTDIDRSLHLSASRSGFHVAGENYLRLKRRGLGNVTNKMLEKAIRAHLIV